MIFRVYTQILYFTIGVATKNELEKLFHITYSLNDT